MAGEKKNSNRFQYETNRCFALGRGKKMCSVFFFFSLVPDRNFKKIYVFVSEPLRMTRTVHLNARPYAYGTCWNGCSFAFGYACTVFVTRTKKTRLTANIIRSSVTYDCTSFSFSFRRKSAIRVGVGQKIFKTLRNKTVPDR